MCCLLASCKFNQLLQQTTKAFRLLQGNPQFCESCFAPNKNKTALLTEKKKKLKSQRNSPEQILKTWFRNATSEVFQRPNDFQKSR